MERPNLSFRTDTETVERLTVLLTKAKRDPMARYFTPTLSSIINEALRRGIDDLEEEWGSDD